MVTAAAAYSFWGRNEPIDFDAADNSPFAWEARLAAAKDGLRKGMNRLRAALPFLPASPDNNGSEQNGKKQQ